LKMRGQKIMNGSQVDINKTIIPKKSFLPGKEISRRYGASIVLVALLVFNVFVTNHFLEVQTLWNILLHVSTTALVSIGMTLVISTGGIDLSVGSIMAVSAVTSTFFLDLNVFLIVILTIAICVVFGFFNGAVISYFGVQPIVVTLAMMIAGRGIAQLVTGGYLVPFSSPSYEALGKGEIASLPIPVIIMFAVSFMIYLAVKYTAFGRYVEAVGDNEKAAKLAGVNVKWVKISVYIVSAALAALAGMIETARLAAADGTRIGELIELDAIAAVVVGGTLMTGGRPYIWKTVMGAILMGLITTTFTMNNINYSYSLVLKAVIIVLAIYIQREKIA
jgi:ribose/xylose/arabinose/galactoside ABC-type transport system permease subunit